MTPRQIILVQLSWGKLAPDAERVAELFYGRLFELDPSLRALFKSDLRQQGAMLMNAMGFVVDNLFDFKPLIPTIEHLGARHAGYGVKDEHYATVGAALLWTLGQGLGEGFDAELEAAWTEVYRKVSGLMRGAMVVAA